MEVQENPKMHQIENSLSFQIWGNKNKDGSPRKKPDHKPRAENGSEAAPEGNSTPQGASTTETGGGYCPIIGV